MVGQIHLITVYCELTENAAQIACNAMIGMLRMSGVLIMIIVRPVDIRVGP